MNACEPNPQNRMERADDRFVAIDSKVERLSSISVRSTMRA